MFHAKFVILIVITALAAAQYRIEPRIVQGHNAVRGQFPFYVFMQLFKPQGIAKCGGSLISDQWVLTAAHCLKNARQVNVHLGTLKSSDWDEEGHRMYQVDAENMHIFPRYSLLLMVWNDIGLIKLPEPVTFSDVIKPIPFACSSPNAGVDVIACGNGVRRYYDLHISKYLLYTELKTISNLSCLKTYPLLMFRQSIVCAEGEGQRSICEGDSGGPLFTFNNSLIGVTSFGKETCEDGSPQVFTRVSEYTKWIKKVSGVECKK